MEPHAHVFRAHSQTKAEASVSEGRDLVEVLHFPVHKQEIISKEQLPFGRDQWNPEVRLAPH